MRLPFFAPTRGTGTLREVWSAMEPDARVAMAADRESELRAGCGRSGTRLRESTRLRGSARTGFLPQSSLNVPNFFRENNRARDLNRRRRFELPREVGGASSGGILRRSRDALGRRSRHQHSRGSLRPQVQRHRGLGPVRRDELPRDGFEPAKVTARPAGTTRGRAARQQGVLPAVTAAGDTPLVKWCARCRSCTRPVLEAPAKAATRARDSRPSSAGTLPVLARERRGACTRHPLAQLAAEPLT
jgi:hypothetical protein